jgi:hypothetical protein
MRKGRFTEEQIVRVKDTLLTDLSTFSCGSIGGAHEDR